MLILATVMLGSLAGCTSGGDVPGPVPTEDILTDVVVPTSTVALNIDEDATIRAKGAQLGDIIVLSDAKGNEYECEVNHVETAKFTFHVSDKIPVSTTDYTYTIQRDTDKGLKEQELYTVKTVVRNNYTAPDKAGYTLRGMVYCNKKGVAGVLVTDGVQIVETDENGYYYINSDKRYGCVYLILPTGYEVKAKNAMPQFWAKVDSTDPTSHQNKSFELVLSDTSQHTAIFVTDIHLANDDKTPLDLTQFRQLFVDEINTEYKGKQHVYCFNLGDFAWDVHWYANQFGDEYNLTNCAAQVATIPAQFWSTMGNHDNNGHTNYSNYTTGNYDLSEKIPYTSDFNGSYWKKDLYASEPFRQQIGPTHVALNLGGVHYILLDDIIYENDYPGKTDGDDKMGMRKYHAGFREDMVQWIKEDLKHVSKTTPIVVGFHIPLCAGSGQDHVSFNGEFSNGGVTASTNVKAFVDLFAGYSEVDFISGHTHVNRFRSIPGYSDNFYEHNIGANSGIWWSCSANCGGTNTKAGKINLCSDGAPAGYMVFEASGSSRPWYWKGQGAARNKQFKTYDMNKVKDAFNTYAKDFITPDPTLTPPRCWANNTSSEVEEGSRIYWYPKDYGMDEADNTIWINVWGYEETRFAGRDPWKVKVTEGGITTDAEPIFNGYHDPMMAFLFEIPKYQVSQGFSSNSCSRGAVPHLFRYVAKSATSTLNIAVTDRFGVVYRETMTRPKPFHDGTSVIWSLE